MSMPRKTHIAMAGYAVAQLEKLAPAKGNGFLGCGEATVIAHDPPDQAGTQ